MMDRKFLIGFLTFVVAGLFLAADAGAGELSPLEVAARIQALYDTTSSMAADFNQITASPMSRRKKEGSGKMVLLKPGKMRWDYLAPDRQVVLCDGKNILMYFAKEKQMLVSAAKQYLESDVAYSFFAGNGNLIEDFEISYPAEEDLGLDESTIVLKIIPKGGRPQIDYILLFAGDDFLVTKLTVFDQFGSKTEITFANIRLNVTIPEETFRFTPPEGTEIIEN